MPIAVHLVHDAADTRLDPYRTLRARESRDVLWAEGPTVVERLLHTTLEVHSLLLTPAAHTRLAEREPARLAGLAAPVFVAEQHLVNEVVGFDLHRGAIAVARRPSLVSLGEIVGRATLVVALEGVNDPENLGAIGRTARALGADALVLDPTCADPWYRRSVRVSMGELLHLPIAREPLETTSAALGAAGFEVWALTPRADADDITSLTPPPCLALLLGAEGPGLSTAALATHRNVRIPIRAAVDSLNVGHALAAALAIVATSRP